MDVAVRGRMQIIAVTLPLSRAGRMTGADVPSADTVSELADAMIGAPESEGPRLGPCRVNRPRPSLRNTARSPDAVAATRSMSPSRSTSPSARATTE